MKGKITQVYAGLFAFFVFIFFSFPPLTSPHKNNKIHLHKLTNRLPHSTFPEAEPYVSHAENVQLGLEKRRFRTRET